MSKVQATPACIIAAGQKKPLKICTSGWRRNSESGSMLDGERWTGLLGLFFLARQMKFTKMSLEDALQGKLREANLPLSQRCATIYLGHKPCKSCLDFLRCIKQLTGISVRTESGPVFSEHKRKRTFYPSDPNVDIAPKDQQAPKNNFDGDDSSDDENEARDKTKEINHDDDKDDGLQDEHEVEVDDAKDSLDVIDAILEEFPIGNVARPRTHDYHANDDHNEHDEDNDDDNEDKHANKDDTPLPPRLLPALNISVRSSPSPSISMASVLDSSVIDRRNLYPIYTSPSPRGGSAAPPSNWGKRSKPPVTPSFEAPDFTTSNLIDLEDEVRSTQVVNEQSYFFGTPSAPSEASIAGVAGNPTMRPPPPPRPGTVARTSNTGGNSRTEVHGTPDSPIILDNECQHSPGIQSTMFPSVRAERARAEQRNRVQQLSRHAAQPPVRTRFVIHSDAADSHRMAIERGASHQNKSLSNWDANERQRSSQAAQRPQPSDKQSSSSGLGISNTFCSPVVDLTVDVDLTNDDDDTPTRPRVDRSNTTPTTGMTNLYIHGQSSSLGSTISHYQSTFPTPTSHPRQQKSLPPPPPRPPRPVSRSRQRAPTAASKRCGIARSICRSGRSGRGTTSSTTTRPFPDLSGFIYDTESGWV
ncbi:hypothetical protein SEUCBS140593_002202 [Sporothrix eucalyptigena]|uniref:Uncharacterized protein n=1 Tax=Sporothrix eucalyptigena TaxID=1812306 RepID=A0ABP0B4J8_9PEZI